MDAAVVELNPLPDPVGAAAEDHHLAVGRRGNLVRRVVCGVVVGRVLDARDGNGVPALHHPQGCPSASDLVLRNAQDLGQVTVGKAVLFRLGEQVVRQFPALRFQNLIL